MNLAIADKELAVASYERRNWDAMSLTLESRAGIFQQSGLLQKDGACDVPVEHLPTVAKMQWQIRQYVERAFLLGSQETFRNFYERSRQWETWNMGVRPGFPERMENTRRDVEALIDHCALACDLSEHTVDWYRAMYMRVLRHASTLLTLATQHRKEEELFGFITAKSPHGKMDAIFGPQGLLLRCADPRDFAELFFGGAATVAERNEEKLESAYGVCKTVGKTPETSFVLMAENYGQQEKETTDPALSSAVVHKHELQHARGHFLYDKSTTLSPALSTASIDPQERCIAYYFGPRLQSEMISWTVTPQKKMEPLFLTDPAPYTYCQDFADYLRTFKSGKASGFSKTTIEQSEKKGRAYMQTVVPPAEAAIVTLAKKYPMPIVREMLRITPLPEWSGMARTLTNE